MKEKEFIQKIYDFIKKEQISIDSENLDPYDPLIINASLEVAKDSKSILGGLYYDFLKKDQSMIRKLKNKIIGKIANIVRNVMEKPLITQQKYNEQIFFLINYLIKENKKLKQELLKNQKNLKKDKK